jgi:hypothetical protein
MLYNFFIWENSIKKFYMVMKFYFNIIGLKDIIMIIIIIIIIIIPTLC